MEDRMVYNRIVEDYVLVSQDLAWVGHKIYTTLPGKKQDIVQIGGREVNPI